MKKQKIGIDARMWDHPGIGRYLRELSSAMHAEPFEHELFFMRAGSKIYSLAEQCEIPWKARNFDLLHAPHFNIPVFFGGRLVVTIHDLTYYHSPEVARSPFAKAYVTWLLRAIQKKAVAILTVSEYTKKDLLENFPRIPERRVFVTPEAAAPEFKKIADENILGRIGGKYSLRKPFILFVGSLKKHKNVPVLIEAVARLRAARGIPHELVLTGKRDSANGELAGLVSRHGFVRYIGEAEGRDLPGLYNLADAFVLPSFREGFGLPVLEAMACGTPVVASNRTSLPEVAGEAGLLFDPDRIDALEDVLYNVLNNNELRKNMIQKGFEQAQRFSWKKTAQQTLDVYRRALA
ncbi:MAG: glycosyltransferase family 4 protein [Candidatus Omnitrophota bacterium]